MTQRISRTWLPVLFLLATAAAVHAEDYSYTINSDNTNTITITGYNGPGGAVVIPSIIDGKTVTIIGDDAFWGHTNLTSVTIPNSVTSIGEEVFFACNYFGSSSLLTSVTIGNGVTNIGRAAFQFQNSLASVTIPDSVTSIGDQAFDGCTKLTNVTIGNSVTSIGICSFSLCSLASITIPNSVTSIGERAFAGCTKLTAITVDAQNSVYSSLDGVLFNKSQTTLVLWPGSKAGRKTIPRSAASLEDYAFLDCPTGSWGGATIGYYFQGNAPSLGGPNVFPFLCHFTVYYLAGTTGWGSTFGGCPTVLWNGIGIPTIKANGATGTVTVNSPNAMAMTIEINDDNSAGAPVEWWVLSLAGSSWYYLNNSIQWSQFDGNLSNCHPLYQGASCNLPAYLLPALNIPGLPISSYTFWFAVDAQMDGILNEDEQTLIDSVNVNVLSALPDPGIKANGATGIVTVNYPDAMVITVELNARAYAGVPADWWVLLNAGSSWFYLDSVVGWTQGDWHPVLQCGLLNLPATEILNIAGLGAGSYTFYFAVDLPMNGILNMEQIWVDAVTVNVR